MTKIGFWFLLTAVVVRAGALAPALLGRRPELAFRLAAAGALLALYAADTILIARRVGRGDAPATADSVWVLGGVGLALAGTLLSLI